MIFRTTLMTGLWLVFWPVCSFQPGSPEDSLLKVITYNIRYDNPSDGINGWPNRRDFVAEILSDNYSPDFFGLQEALFSQVFDLQQRLRQYGWVGVGRDDGLREGEFSPIFYKRNRLEVLEHSTFWLSQTPELPGSTSWDAAITRIVSWVKFKDRRTGRIFYHLNTHFDHRGKQARTESVHLIRKKINDIAGDAPVVLTGDFNFAESSSEYALLVAEAPGLVRLLDCRYLAAKGHEGPTASFTDWFTSGPPESRIDYIFVSRQFDVLTHRILDDRLGDRFPSDHLPVLADLTLK